MLNIIFGNIARKDHYYLTKRNIYIYIYIYKHLALKVKEMNFFLKKI